MLGHRISSNVSNQPHLYITETPLIKKKVVFTLRNTAFRIPEFQSNILYVSGVSLHLLCTFVQHKIYTYHINGEMKEKKMRLIKS